MLETQVSTLKDLVNAASNAWTGIDWDSDLDTTASLLEKIAKALDGEDEDTRQEIASKYGRKVLTIVDEGIRSWVADNGSHTSQVHRKAVGVLVRDLDKLDLSDHFAVKDLAREARDLADEEDGEVEGRANDAAEEGGLAVEAAEAGDWEEAVRRLEHACAIERTYGDSPVWGKVLAFARTVSKAKAEAEGDATIFDEEFPGEFVSEGWETEAFEIAKKGVHFRNVDLDVAWDVYHEVLHAEVARFVFEHRAGEDSVETENTIVSAVGGEFVSGLGVGSEKYYKFLISQVDA